MDWVRFTSYWDGSCSNIIIFYLRTDWSLETKVVPQVFEWQERTPDTNTPFHSCQGGGKEVKTDEEQSEEAHYSS
jgi:hypothetical protein